jgi:predicted ATPase
MASVPHAKSLEELENMYSNDLSMRSHGEAYLDFFASRLKPKQLYLLDEPETPLSTQNQLTLLAMIKTAVEEDCQFIIATHSPIIMAYPGATLYEIGNNQIQSVQYDEIESIQLLKQFLNQPGQFIRHL